MVEACEKYIWCDVSIIYHTKFMYTSKKDKLFRKKKLIVEACKKLK